MENTSPPLTKLEHEYIMTNNKREQLIEKLEEKLKITTQEKTEITEKFNSVTTENSKLTLSNEALTKEVAELHTELNDTVTQCQEHIDNIEGQHDELEKQNEELKKQIEDLKSKTLSDSDIQFLNSCRADTILQNAFDNGLLVLTDTYLKENNFPDVFLTDKDFNGITTTNFKLNKDNGETNFTLTKT